MTCSTTSFGAEAPAVTPTTSDGSKNSAGISAAVLTRATRSQPASLASFSRARVFDEFAEPMTTIAPQRAASSISADCRLVVAKHRSLRPGVQASG